MKTFSQISHNFISNNCIGGRLFEVLNEEYCNPFIWTIVMPDDFLFLVENWDNIDFSKYVISSGNLTKHKVRRWQWTIDKKVNLIAYHYVKDPKCTTPIKIDSDLHVADIEKLMCEKYEKRIKRMKNRKPTFVFSGFDLPQFDINEEQIKKFLSIKTPYTRILLTTDVKWLKFNTHDNRMIFKALSGSALNNAKMLLEKLN